MYDRLLDLATRPAPFSRTTTRDLWTDPHIAARMLGFHLDGSNDLASRRTQTISGFVDWVDARFGLTGKRVLDLGCGPGLYALPMAQRGAHVTGLDFSATSLAHARREAAAAGRNIEYREADYLADELPPGQDLITLIYCDYGALPPDSRQLLLAKIRAALVAGGTFILDAFPPAHAAAVTEGLSLEQRMHGRFFAPGDYFGLRARHRYESDLTLDRYLIVAPDREFEIWNWDQCFTPAALAAELHASGLVADDAVEIATGTPWSPGDQAFALMARAV